MVKILLLARLPGSLLLGVIKVLLGSWIIWACSLRVAPHAGAEAGIEDPISWQIFEDLVLTKFRILGCKIEGVASLGLWIFVLIL